MLTTHYMEEADELCDRVAIIDHGKILVEDTPAALKGSVGAQKVYELDLRSQRGHSAADAEAATALGRCQRGADTQMAFASSREGAEACCRMSSARRIPTACAT